jgi:outer membrane receptor protein involved in Fe transport
VPLDPNARNERDRFVSSLTARWTSTSGTLTQHLRAQHYQEDFVFEDQHDNVLGEVGEAPFFIFDADFLLNSRRDRTTLEYGGRYTPASAALVSYGVLWSREVVQDTTDGQFGAGRQSLDRNSRAAYAELLLSPSARIDLLGGIRVEEYEGLAAAWTPRASVVVHALPGRLSLRAAAGRAFKAPNLQQQYLDNPFIRSNPDLAAETSTSWEAGADLRTADGNAALALTWFSQQFDDLIRTVAVEGSSTGQQINRNLGESSAHGIEWDGRWQIARALTAGVRGSWVETRIEENVGLNGAEYPLGGALPFRPEFVHSVYLESALGSRLDARLGATHIGEQTVLAERFSGPRERLDAYVSANVALRFRVREGVALHARADNLFNAEYQTGFDRGGAPLNVALGLRVGRD